MLRVGSLLKFAALLAAGACFAMDAQAQTTPVTFSLDFRALGRHAAWYVALEKGYYKDAGLDVTIIPSQGTHLRVRNLEALLPGMAFRTNRSLACSCHSERSEESQTNFI